MSGRAFAVVGPSGAGKDTLLQAALARRPDLYLVRRVITRGAEAGGEDFEGVSATEFARRDAAGDFALTWQAHGLSYAIPEAAREAQAEGRDVVFNGSRAMLGAAAEAFADLRVILVTAPREVLAARLSERGRESADEIAARVDRAVPPLPEGLPVTEIDNGGALGPAVEAMLAALQPVRA
ncbi:phosphonate metabolism protein/1,5-bisphosphokinase (PRPP-forming) PhnN [Roseivivax sediminis]|uniref:Ribose 1,5-bisphosphate phosphokinase PhnN n=1 Tax=Roseivivax sediminis TaxID=936889 RepID=A0A1I2A0K0_9RHOB|nr:phosphonate metabolism protein/1,5-bisphosphokinase (PRPP-forming) PhnN [Roseivivax sediminis]SFE37485.1 ribose 1,5-bisphosphokinase [Roseivivax sediminis]